MADIDSDLRGRLELLAERCYTRYRTQTLALLPDPRQVYGRITALLDLATVTLLFGALLAQSLAMVAASVGLGCWLLRLYISYQAREKRHALEVSALALREGWIKTVPASVASSEDKAALIRLANLTEYIAGPVFAREVLAARERPALAGWSLLSTPLLAISE